MTHPKHNHYDYKDVDYRHSSMGPQMVRLRRDIEGYLVGRTNLREALIFTTWAETSAGIPYGFEINTYWTHWVATEPTPVPVPVPVPNDVIAPEKLRSIERQVYEQENGVGPYAAAAASAKSPAVPASSTLARHIDSSATLEDVRRENDRYVLTLRVTARGQVTRTIENLRVGAKFNDVQDHGIIASGNQKDFATLSLKLRQ